MSFSDLFKTKKETPKCSAVIVAAGSSKRMGYDKLDASLAGITVLERTLRAFDSSAYVDEIVIVTRMKKVPEVADLCAARGFSKVTKIIAGGKTRMESSLIGVSSVRTSAKLIAIHDAARPLVTEALIGRCVREAAEHMAAVPVIASTDTLKALDDSARITGTVDRERVYRVQTPQVFESVLIKGALSSAVDSRSQLSDDSSAVERTGFHVYTVAGEEENIKVTTPRDMLIAEAILKARET